jgi:iron(III)-enterobactin esterase
MRLHALPLVLLVAACGSSAEPEDPVTTDTAGDASVQEVREAGVGGHVVRPDASPKATGGTASVGTDGGNARDGGGGSLGTGGVTSAWDGAAGTSSEGDGDFTIGAPYSDAPELTVKPGVPQGTLHDFNLSSTLSAIYPVEHTNRQPFGRNVSVYVPKQYVTGTAAPFIVVQDGISFYRSTMVPVLDNMIGDRRLPVMIAVFVEPGPNGPTPEGERSFEYDTVSDDYLRFVETELLPKIEKDYGLTLTTDPDGRAAMGGSSGGAAAFTMGWFRPDLYHRILTYSGSFCDLQQTASYPHGAWTYHESLIANTEAKPLRVALEVGENDGNWNTSTDQYRDWRAANRGMAAALAAKGYHYRFVYALGVGHMDSGVLKQTLPETLAWLWQGYPIP